MSLPIQPTPILTEKEFNEFLKKVKEDLKFPVGLVPTPKLSKAIELIRKEKEKIN